VCSARRASAIEAGSQIFRAANTENAEGVINFTIRYRSDVYLGMWVRCLATSGRSPPWASTSSSGGIWASRPPPWKA